MDDRPFEVHASELAHAQFAALEPALQEEVRDHLARVAEDPAETLFRYQSAQGMRDLYAYRFWSEVIDELAITLVLAQLDLEARTAVLVQISHAMEDR